MRPICVCFSLILLLGIFLGSSSGSTSPVGAGEVLRAGPQDRSLRESARKRLYPGGRDEESLKVLSSLPSPVRKRVESTDFEAEVEPEVKAPDAEPNPTNKLENSFE